MPKRIQIIGAGVSGLAAAAHLSKQGYKVDVFEKNHGPGGRISSWEKDGFRFDMGPSWYWMPQVFEDFFEAMGSSSDEHYSLMRLDPSYRVFFGENDKVDVPAGWEEIRDLFESIEKGSASRLEDYMKEAAYKYEVGMNEFVWKPGSSLMEYAHWKVINSFFRLDMFTSMSRHVRKHFKDERLIKIMEFPVLFLGASPNETPALYSLMNYADLKLGTWYPQGGMFEVAKAMETVAQENGARFHYHAEIDAIKTHSGRAIGLEHTFGNYMESDGIIAAADYHHVDHHLLPEKDRQYSEVYWNNRKLAPSSLLFFIGLDCPIPGLLHHNLFFDEDFNKHASSIYKNKQWPEQPLFYACCPSKTDVTVAPDGHENLFLLVPLAPGLKDREEEREQLFQYMSDKLNRYTGIDITNHIVVKRSFAISDFKQRYHSYKGNAYGLANTLRQTAFLKPSMHHKKLKNLLFAGQLTVPGPGLPPSIISGRLAAMEMDKYFNKRTKSII